MILLLRRATGNFVRYRRFGLSENQQRNVGIVGSAEESHRVRQLLEQAAVPARIIGYIEPARTVGGAGGPEVAVAAEVTAGPAAAGAAGKTAAPPPDDLLGEVRQLEDIIRIYGLDELVFCGRDLPASQIIGLMAGLPQHPPVAFKILPPGSQYIIGSSGKDSPGDYYALDITLNLFRPEQVRNKRLLDILSSLLLLVLSPVLVWFEADKTGFLRNCLRVLAGARTWVGLRHAAAPQTATRAILSPADAVPATTPLDEATRRRLELLYAKDYHPATDWRIMAQCLRQLGREE